jgi:hypothetical protein
MSQGELANSIVKNVDDTPSAAELPSLPKITKLELSDDIIYAAGFCRLDPLGASAACVPDKCLRHNHHQQANVTINAGVWDLC